MLTVLAKFICFHQCSKKRSHDILEHTGVTPLLLRNLLVASCQRLK